MTFSWSKCRSNLSSLSVRLAVVSLRKTFDIFLIAHGCPRASRAEQTTPNEPHPMNFWMVYAASTTKSVPRMVADVVGRA
eukprot:scaffold12123_cov32-Tisochrysis_lutea.AAC.1